MSRLLSRYYSCFFQVLISVIIIFALNIFATKIFAKNITNGIEYISPVQASTLNNIHTSIIFRLTSPPHAINDISISITGAIRGSYSYTIKAADDQKTLIIKTDSTFKFNENVTVNISPILMRSGQFSDSYTLNFLTQRVRSGNSGIETNSIQSELGNVIASPFRLHNSFASLPSDFPLITVTTNNDPTPGGIFLSNLVIGNAPTQYKNYLMILNNNGFPFYYKKLPQFGADFKMLDNGNFVYYELNKGFYEMDNDLNLIDSFYAGNGYSTDIHDFHMLSDGSYYIMSYDTENLDMRSIVNDGYSNALVTGGIIQKFDAHKNLVFQWRSWDNFEITDATHELLSAPLIDYAHINAIEPLDDGNILISSRHMDEITKINTLTGEIIWRLGGENNQFTFLNDEERFSHQHAIRMLPNGNITLFDNGNFHSTPHSRAVEYKIDEFNKTVELVWQYRNSPDNYGFALGYVQRLPNGNTLIGWGASIPSVTEVKPDGTKVLELSLPTGMYSYRAYKFDWFRYVNTEIPAEYSLKQNFPNPFNPSTKIKFDLPANGHVKLSVTDILGKEVSVLVNENLSTGVYEYTFTAAGLSSGVYFYTLNAGGKIQSKRMMLLK